MKRGLLLIGMLALLVISLGLLFQFQTPTGQAQTEPPTVPPTKPPIVPPTEPPTEAQSAGKDKDRDSAGIGVGVGLAMDVLQIEPRLQAGLDKGSVTPEFQTSYHYVYSVKLVCGDTVNLIGAGTEFEDRLLAQAQYNTSVNVNYLPGAFFPGSLTPGEIKILAFAPLGNIGNNNNPTGKALDIKPITDKIQDPADPPYSFEFSCEDFSKLFANDDFTDSTTDLFLIDVTIDVAARPLTGRSELIQPLEVTAVYTALNKQVETGKDKK